MSIQHKNYNKDRV